MRTSVLGLQHFYHAPCAPCAWQKESAEHLAAKCEIIRVCTDVGYHAVPEAIGPDWRADVLASRGSHRVVFEVQLSAQSLARTRERQEHYTRDGIRACWLFGNAPGTLMRPGGMVALIADRELPVFL